MFCPKCGKQNSETSAFCVACGQKLTSTEQPMQQPVQQPIYQQPPVQQPIYQQPPVQQFQPQYAPAERPFSSNHILNELKRFAASPFVIIAVILFTLSIVITIATASDSVLGMLYMIEDYVEIPELDEIIDGIDDAVTLIAFITMIPSIVIGIGLWVTVGTALNKNSDTMATGGLTTIKVMNIISIVFTSISIALVVFYITHIASNDIYGVVPPIVYSILVAIVLALGLRIFYLAKVNSTLNSFIYSVRSAYPSYGASLFVAVMCFIIGGFSALSMFFDFNLASLLSAVATIFFGVIIIQCRSLVYRLVYECQAAQR